MTAVAGGRPLVTGHPHPITRHRPLVPSLMNTLEELTCANCGAAMRLPSTHGPVVICDHCGTSFRLAATLTPEPEMGDLMLGSDFRDPDLPGWKVFNRDKLEFRPGSPAELWVNHPASELIHPILRTPGPLDDFDIGVTIRFIEGKYDYVSSGFELRSGDDGDYVIRISAQGTFHVGWHNKTAWGAQLVDWTEHPSLRKAMGQPNRMRVLFRGDQLRLYMNGVLATSLRDARFSFGYLRLVVSPSKEAAAVVAYSDLQLRDVK